MLRALCSIALAVLLPALCFAQSGPGLDIQAGSTVAVKSDLKDGFLNLRSGASATAPVVDKLPAGTSGLTMTGRTTTNGETRWVEVRHDGRTGWVNARFIIRGIADGVAGTAPPTASEPRSIPETPVATTAVPPEYCNSDEAIERIAGCTQLLSMPDLDPTTRAIALGRRSDAYLVRLNLDKALLDRQGAKSIEPNNPDHKARLLELLLLRSEVRLLKEDYAGAGADIQSAQAIAPDNPDVIRKLVNLLDRRGLDHILRGQLDRAIADYSEAIQHGSTVASLHLHRGIAHARSGHSEMAIDDLTAAVRLAPSSPDAYVERGQLLAAKGDQDRARADLDAAITRDPKHAPALLRRGHLHELSGNRDLAIADYTAVWKSDQRNDVARSGLERLGRPQISAAPADETRAPRRLVARPAVAAANKKSCWTYADCSAKCERLYGASNLPGCVARACTTYPKSC